MVEHISDAELPLSFPQRFLFLLLIHQALAMKIALQHTARWCVSYPIQGLSGYFIIPGASVKTWLVDSKSCSSKPRLPVTRRPCFVDRDTAFHWEENDSVTTVWSKDVLPVSAPSVIDFFFFYSWSLSILLLLQLVWQLQHQFSLSGQTRKD